MKIISVVFSGLAHETNYSLSCMAETRSKDNLTFHIKTRYRGKPAKPGKMLHKTSSINGVTVKLPLPVGDVYDDFTLEIVILAYDVYGDVGMETVTTKVNHKHVCCLFFSIHSKSNDEHLTCFNIRLLIVCL